MTKQRLATKLKQTETKSLAVHRLMAWAYRDAYPQVPSVLLPSVLGLLPIRLLSISKVLTTIFLGCPLRVFQPKLMIHAELEGTAWWPRNHLLCHLEDVVLLVQQARSQIHLPQQDQIVARTNQI
jgi:hypothetical protein